MTKTPKEWINTDPTHAINRMIADAAQLAGYPLFHHLALPTEAFGYDRSAEELSAVCDALLQEATDLMLLRRALETAPLNRSNLIYARGLVEALATLERCADDICVRLMTRIEFDQDLCRLIDAAEGATPA